MPGESVLVTGASGFIGARLAAALRRRGEPVIEHRLAHGDLAREELRVAGDVRHVYHLAARTYVPESWKNPRAFYETNVLGTVAALEFCRARQASITLMSSYVYGRPERLPIAEDHPVQAFNPYSSSKILAEQAAEFYRTAFRVPVAIIRPFNIYGPGQAPHFLIPTLIDQALDPACEAIAVADDRPRRDYLFIDDLIDLLLRQLEHPGATGIYNAGSGNSISVRALAELVMQAAGVRKPVVSRGEERPEEVPDTVADISKARRSFGWAPATDLEQGLRRTLEGRF